MTRTKVIVLGALVFASCTDLNVQPRTDDGAVSFDAPLDAGPDGLGGAGFAGGGNGGGGGAGAAAGAGGGGGRAAAGAGGGGGRAAAGAGGGGGHATAGAGGAPQGGKAGGGGAGGKGGGAGGATASCPAGTKNPCTPNMIDTVEEVCCATGKRTQSRKCDPVTCQWGSFGAWSSCAGVQAVCTPGATTTCTNSDPCGNRVCSSACTWGACVPKSGNECLCLHSGHTDCGSNYRCGTGSHAGQWQFCLQSCVWSGSWEDCSAQNCEC